MRGTNKYTPRDLISAPRHATSHQSLSEAQTNILREVSALRATLLRTSPSPRHKQIYSARSHWRSAPRYFAPVSLRGTNKYTTRDLSAPRHATPHQSLSEAQTNILREISALRATLLRTSPSPRHKQIYYARSQHSAPRYSAPVPLRGTNKYTTRDLTSAPRHATPHQSLSEAQTNILREISLALHATLLPTSLERDWCEAQTNILREISLALRATLLRTSLSPRHKQIYYAKSQHSAPRYSAPVPLRGTNKYTPRDLTGAPRHATSHQSLSEAQTNILREISALRATLLPTSLERDWCEAQTNILREISLALRATLLRTSLSPRHKQIYYAKSQHSAPRYSAPVPLRGTNKYTTRDLISAPRHATPHQSLSEAQTNILREISLALRATLLRTNPSPRHKQIYSARSH